MGIRGLSPAEALEAFGALIESDAVQATVLPVNWSELASQFNAAAPPPLFEECLRNYGKPSPGSEFRFRARLAAQSREEISLC